MDQKENDRTALNEELNKSGLKPYDKRQIQAILSYMSGLDSAKIAEELDVERRTIQRYIKMYTESGIKSILTKQKPGNSQKLTPEIQEELKIDLIQGPHSGGYVLEGWTASLLAKHIKKKYKIMLNAESCRQLLRKVLPEPKKYRTLRSGFKEKVSGWIKEGSDVWLVGDLFLGYVKPSKIQKTRRPYLPWEEFLSDEEIQEKKIDLTRESKKIILTLSKNLRTKRYIHRIDSYFQDKVEIRRQFLKELVKQSQSNKIVIILKRSNINTSVATSVSNNKSVRTIIVVYRPPVDTLNDLDEVKAYLIKRYKLRGPFKGPKTISEKTRTLISDYLNQIRSNS